MTGKVASGPLIQIDSNLSVEDRPMPDDAGSPAPPISLKGLRECQWSAPERAALISVVAIAMAALFVTTYTLALGNPVPHGIPIAVVGDPASHQATMQAIAQVAGGPNFRVYASLLAALSAVDWQQVYAALDLTSDSPTLYVASAAGVSVARALARIPTIDPSVRIVDTHPLGARDPNGLDLFY